MSKIDGRKIPHPVRESIRHEAIQKWIAGATVTQLSQEYGTDATCVRRWYKAHGFEGLNTRSIAHSKNAKLSPAQPQQLKTWILTQNPTHFGHYKILWTRDIITLVIKKEFNIKIHPAAVGKMVKKLGLTPQRPVRKAWQQDEKNIRSVMRSIQKGKRCCPFLKLNIQPMPALKNFPCKYSAGTHQ